MGSETTFLMEPMGTFSVLSEEKKKKKESRRERAGTPVRAAAALLPAFRPTFRPDPQLVLLQLERESDFPSGLVEHPR